MYDDNDLLCKWMGGRVSSGLWCLSLSFELQIFSSVGITFANFDNPSFVFNNYCI